MAHDPQAAARIRPAKGPGGSTTAAELVEAGAILPVLDGFDEIAVGLYGEALGKLDSTSSRWS